MTFDRYPHASFEPEASSQARNPHGQDRRRQLDVTRLPDHRERLFRAAYALCGSREEAEDLVQETYVRVLRKPRFLHRDDDLAYLLKVLRNTWINMYKERLRRPKTVEFDESTDFVVDPDADPGLSVAEVQALYAAVHELSPPLRDTLVAVDILGLSYKQAAQALRVRQGTIMSRLHRARENVAKRLDQDELQPLQPRT
jgi:RNA polymerase sigma-70 factor, ECF subfamily